jgi:hypothetical protein
MTTRTLSAHSSVPLPLRLKTGTGDDTIYASGATVPSAGTRLFPSRAPAGKGKNSEIELFVVAVDNDGTVQARGACTFTLHCEHIVERQPDAAPGVVWPDVAIATAPLVLQALQSAIRVPWNGGTLSVGLTSIASPPAGATGFQIWAKPVAG